VLLLAACSSDQSGETATDDTTAPTGSATIVDTGGTRTITHPLGTADVPANPKRVVALGEEFLLADLLDLGVTPVASTATTGTFEGLDAVDVSGIEQLPSTEADIERLVSLDPDLIITDVGTAELAGYDRLSQVAPTVAIDGSDWRQSYLDTAAVFGQTPRAEARLTEYDDAVADARTSLATAGRTVSVATIYPGDSVALWIDGPTNVPQVLLDLGFTLVPGPGELDDDRGRAYISAERVDLASGQDLVMMQSSSVEGEDAAYASFTEGPLWSSLPAVAADDVLVVDRLGYPGTPGRLALVELFRTEL
jgi:iron complex transport system substrate-binding protein